MVEPSVTDHLSDSRSQMKKIGLSEIRHAGALIRELLRSSITLSSRKVLRDSSRTATSTRVEKVATAAQLSICWGWMIPDPAKSAGIVLDRSILSA
jgi:hypothetical protein